MSPRAFWHRLVRPSSSGGNPVLDWLDAAGVPWRATRGELAARFGVGADNPYKWESVSLDIQPSPLDGMLWPLGFQAFARYNPAMPPERLSTHVWVGDDAEGNIGHAAAQLARSLGAQPVVDRYNTRYAEWRWDAASVCLTVWPRAMQSGAKLLNPAHNRDERLEAACLVTVQTGWRPPLSAQDRAWLDGYVPIGPTRNWTSARPHSPFGRSLVAETLLEFMRQPSEDHDRFRGTFGLSADGRALIACEDALYVVSLDQVEGFEVTRTLPAKGGGGSALSARCNTGYTACPTKNVPVVQGAGADELNDVAARLTAATGKPFKLGDYGYDV